MADSAPEQARILVVDDEPSNLRLLGELLLAAGYQVSVARSGEQALQLVGTHPPSLVILDVVMPGMNGYEVCQRLRASKDTRAIPVLIVTGSNPIGNREMALSAGADEFLTKPIDSAQLIGRVRTLLNGAGEHIDP